MRIISPCIIIALVAVLFATSGNAQLFQNFFRNVGRGMHNIFRPVMHMFNGGRPEPAVGFRPPGRFNSNLDKTGGTKKPQATGIDKTYPDDCGRDEKNKGKLCFPDGKLCQERVNRQGNERYGNHLYWFSWNSDDNELRNAKWDWFNARNYCRKRCMDLVSIETQDEYEWIKQRMGGVKYIWTSGRLCNFDGCDNRPEFEPKHINGWFWSANQARLNPTNGRQFHDWSNTGGLSARQPDNREGKEGGEEEACLAVLNNFYGDGIKWHDVACGHEKPIVCEDVEGHIQYARNQFPNLQIP